MATLKAIRREMISRLPGESLGRVEAIASLAVGSVTVTALATGGRSSDEFTGKYMVRAEAANVADRVRRISSYTTGSGLLSHGGTNYADTTATSETVEILRFEPYLLDNAINLSLARLRRRHVTEFATVQGQRAYNLSDLTWVQGPGDLTGVSVRESPVLARDEWHQSWGTVNTSGALQPDWWTLSGSGASVARSTAHAEQRQYTAALTRSGTNATFGQTIGLLLNGTPAANGEDLRGKTVTVAGRVWADTGSQIRLQALDGTQTVSTSYHTGDSTVQELSTTIAVASTATTLTVRWSIEVDGTAYVVRTFPLENTLTDPVRRDAYREFSLRPGDYELDTSYAQPMLRIGDGLPRGRQLRIWTARAYPQFDSARLAAGSADADSTDAPLDVVAAMAIARLFEGEARNPGEDTGRFASIAGDWGRRAERLALAHLAQTEPPKGGIGLPRGLAGVAARRF